MSLGGSMINFFKNLLSIIRLELDFRRRKKTDKNKDPYIYK